MFVDSVLVVIAAGRGGDGKVNFRHEKFIDKGGPDGGDGGRGGDVVFQADENLNTLSAFRYKQELKAENGHPGEGRRMHGRDGKKLIISVPVGTLVYRDKECLADLTQPGQQAVIAHGGSGGFGNAHFKSSTRQTPRVAELGEKGDAFDARLELKLIADVGLVGFPNAGKSTFLSVVSNARPEIADYAFTTLTPNLGVADIDDTSLLIADIPGLIEGASKGKGLGDAFLKHVERTAVLLHLIDAYQDDPAVLYKAIRAELKAYGAHLEALPEVVALTKIDGLDEEIVNHQLAQLQAVVPPETPLVAISSLAHTGTEEVLRILVEKVAEERRLADVEEASEETMVTISLSDTQKESGWRIEKHQDMFIVRGDKIEKFAARTDYKNIHSVNRLRDIMRKLGVSHELVRSGAEGKDIITFGDSGEYRMTLEEQQGEKG